MEIRTIGLPNGKSVRIAVYVNAWREVKRLTTAGRGKHPIAGWDHFPTDAEVILRAMQDGMTDRINRHLPWYGRGRKWEWQWQRDAKNVAWNLNGRRIVTRVRDVPKELQPRLAHRLHEDAA